MGLLLLLLLEVRARAARTTCARRRRGWEGVRGYYSYCSSTPPATDAKPKRRCKLTGRPGCCLYVCSARIDRS